jgi:DNA-directed RNA polymerase specialized sigma subunit
MNLKELSSAVGRAEPFTTEQNDAVYQRLMAGDKSARDEMIEGNVALVVYRVDAYLRMAPQMSYYRDDMIASGLLGLCDAVDGMSKKGVIRKPTGYISIAIDRYVSHAADEANAIVVPFQAQAAARQEGTPMCLPRTVSDSALTNYNDLSTIECEEVLALTEEVLACCQDDVERRIVSMRVDGYTDEEIGQALAIQRRHVSRMREGIFKRFNERCPEYKETERAKTKRLAKEAAAAAKKAARKAAK